MLGETSYRWPAPEPRTLWCGSSDGVHHRWAGGASQPWLRATASFEDALYVSTSMFSTLGNDGTFVDSHWRLMAALEGINGFLLIGWSTAFLVRASTRHGPFRKEEHF